MIWGLQPTDNCVEMVQILLASEQAAAIQQADEPVVLVDAQGAFVARAAKSPFGERQIKEAEARIHSAGPWRTTQEVLERLDQMQ